MLIKKTSKKPQNKKIIFKYSNWPIDSHLSQSRSRKRKKQKKTLAQYLIWSNMNKKSTSGEFAPKPHAV